MKFISISLRTETWTCAHYTYAQPIVMVNQYIPGLNTAATSTAGLNDESEHVLVFFYALPTGFGVYAVPLPPATLSLLPSFFFSFFKVKLGNTTLHKLGHFFMCRYESLTLTRNSHRTRCSTIITCGSTNIKNLCLRSIRFEFLCLVKHMQVDSHHGSASAARF